MSFVSVVCCQRSLCWADHSFRGVLPNVVCECDREASIMRRPWPTRGFCAMGEIIVISWRVLVIRYTYTGN